MTLGQGSFSIPSHSLALSHQLQDLGVGVAACSVLFTKRKIRLPAHAPTRQLWITGVGLSFLPRPHRCIPPPGDSCQAPRSQSRWALRQ